jgi:hypothetical protein
MDSSTIDNTLVEMRSEKVALRLKAFNKFYDLLQSRQSEIQQLAKRDEDFSWEEIFRSAHQGTVSHARKLGLSGTELLESDAKIQGYARTLLLICDSPQNGENQGEPVELLMISCFQSLVAFHTAS